MKTRLGSAMLRIIFPLACLLSTPCANADKGELVFGVYPYLSPNQIVEQFTPLVKQLSEALGQTVTLRSAPNFEQFIERTHAGEYDIIFTAPHMGRLAEKHDNYRPLAQTGYPIVIIALTKKDAPIQSLANLRGHTIAVGAKLSMTYQIINQALGKSGLELGRNVNFVDTASFSNVLEAILHGEADAGATGTLLWDSAPAGQRDQLREIYRSEAVPGFLLLGHPRIDKTTLKKLQRALYDFGKTPAGKAYFSKTRQIDFRPLNAPSR
jgi:phosphonate transport system substrate-binding protein